jgi:hypothetical protein
LGSIARAAFAARIIGRMRAVLLFLMVALLPLRMWAADGMAVRMAHEQLHAASAAPANRAAMPDDCPMLQAHGDDTDTPAGSHTAAGAHCSSCHLCAAATSSTPSARASVPSPTGPADVRPSRYSDAQLSRALRPPIS